MSLPLAFKKKNPLIVFVHGILGFETITLPGLSIHYFRKLEQQLSFLELPILFPKLPAVGTIADRAKQLATFLSPYKEKDIYIIAHSMGGLDSRYFIHNYDPENRVRVLATVGTPHRGTSLATWFSNDNSLIAKIGRSISRPGIFDLTPEACHRFNERVPDRGDVRYLSYAGCRPVPELSPLTRSWARGIQEKEGDNDSQVPVTSAIWGEFHEKVRADHFELVGWSCSLANRKISRPFDHLTFYQEIVRKIMHLDV
ncbi:MAG: thioesterase [Desulfobulbaceae bacterium]|nr:thioesterase [Desulfobulbaceae bacterium]